MRRATDAFTPRVALVVALGVAWLNFLLTVKWAHLPGDWRSWSWSRASAAAAVRRAPAVAQTATVPVSTGFQVSDFLAWSAETFQQGNAIPR